MSKKPYYKNPLRDQNPDFKPYVPQYRIKGLEPTPIATTSLSEAGVKVGLIKQQPKPSYDNPRLRPAPSISANVPYAELPPDTVKFGPPLPNVGNNLENTWAAIDGELFHGEVFDDQLELDPNRPMIDNNFDDAANYSDIPEEMEAPPTERYGQPPVFERDESTDYLLILKEKVISTGSLAEIEAEVKALVFGEHPLCNKVNFETDDIVVYKKMKIKVGVFIE